MLLVLVCAPSAAASHDYDSIFRTANTNWDCSSGGGTPGVGDVYCQTDNANYEFWIADGPSASEKGQIRSVLNFEYDDTVLNTVETSSPTFNAPDTGETDLILDEVELTNYFPGATGALGVAWCNDAIGGLRCDQHYVFIDNDVTPNYGGAVFTKVACHEIGHSVGLTHPTEAAPSHTNGDDDFKCMNQGVLTYTSPGPNNKHQINIVYG